MQLPDLEMFYQNELVFPVLECLHIAALALSVGTIAVVDFRLLGFGMLRQNPADLTRELAPWTMAGVGVVLMSGTLLYMSDPDLYYLNNVFLLKMALLIAALVFHYTLRSRMMGPDGAGAQARTAGLLSICLWSGVIAGGIFTSFV